MKQYCGVEIFLRGRAIFERWQAEWASGHPQPAPLRWIADNTRDKVGRAVPCLLGRVRFPAEYRRQWFAPLVFQGIRDPAGLRRGVGEYLAVCFSRWRGTYYLKTSPDYHMVKDCFLSIQEPWSLRAGERGSFPKGQTAFMPFLWTA